MGPLSTTTIRRPFHWGLVVLVGRDWAGEYPEVRPDRPVTASDRVVLIPVVHAQDTDEFEGDSLVFAAAEVVVRRWARMPEMTAQLQEVYRGRLEVPNGDLTVGDADSWATVPVGAGSKTIAVSYDQGTPLDDSPDRVWIDLAPAEDP